MITVLGATGNVGGKVVAQLLAQNHKVRAVGRDSAKLKSLHKGAEIKVGDINDPRFLAEAFRGADAAFVMIPPDYGAPSFSGVYKKASESIVQAIKESGVKYIVSLSSFGADLEEGTGPIKYLHSHEGRLNRIEGINVLHLRPAYFFENLLANVPLIQSQSIMGSHISADVKIPMIATADIASAAVKALLKRDFRGNVSQELLGPEEITMDEAAAIVSEVVGKTVKYIAFDAASTKQALTGMGFSADTANLFVEMSEALNSGLIKSKRDAKSTTPTKFGQFAQAFKV